MATLVAFLTVRGVQAKGLQYIDLVVPFTSWRPVMPCRQCGALHGGGAAAHGTGRARGGAWHCHGTGDLVARVTAMATLVALLIVRGVQARGLQYIDVVVPFTRWRLVMR